MNRLFTIFIILFSVFTVWSQKINTVPKLTAGDIYLQITYLQESQNFYNETEGRDFAYRFIVTSNEIFDQVYIEKVIYGEEGGAKKILWRKKLDMDVFYKLGITGEISNVGFDKWPDEEKLNISVYETQFEVSNLNSNSWTITRIN